MIANWNIISAQPGRVVGPIVPYEHGSIKAAYDPRRLIRNNVVPPQGIPPPCCFSRDTEKPERPDITESGRDSLQPKHQKCTSEKLTPVMAIGTISSSFYLSRAAKAESAGSQITMEANLLQARSQFVGISAAAAATAAAATAAHRSTSTVQCGMSTMF